MAHVNVVRRRIVGMLVGFGLLALSGAGNALPLLSAPNVVQFPYGVVSFPVAITNVGGASITISGINTTGDPPADVTRGYFLLDSFTSTCFIGRVLLPGDSCVFKYGYVRLTPDANSELVSITLGFNLSFETMLVTLLADAAPSAIPALSEQTLLLLVAAMAIVATATLRRRDA